ncbi:MAG: methyltransferase domain-containing protein [Rhodoferax sp.]|nr:methyltransferase domain-containing protein [Rhodoferax sp.]
MLSTPLPGGDLYACARCGLQFRHPTLTPSQYADLYRQVETTHWQSSTLRLDESYVLHKLTGLPKEGASVLDVGCFTGTVLNRLPASVQKFGIEPSEQARDICAANGIHIIGRSFEELVDAGNSFDAVISLDVIEHVPDPLHFLHCLARVTKPGGVLIIATGDADSPVWKFVGPAYYYSQNPEHISFISARWCQFAAEKLGLRLDEVRHPERWGEERPASLSTALSGWVTVGAKLVLSRLEYLLARMTAGRDGTYAPRFAVGRPRLARDHLLAAFVKT